MVGSLVSRQAEAARRRPKRAIPVGRSECPCKGTASAEESDSGGLLRLAAAVVVEGGGCAYSHCHRLERDCNRWGATTLAYLIERGNTDLGVAPSEVTGGPRSGVVAVALMISFSQLH